MEPKNSIGDVLRTLGDFIERFAAEGEDGAWSKSGEVGDERAAKAVYGFSVRAGRGGRPLVERFGSVHPRPDAAVDVREPMVDLFDEGSYIRVVAELPGVDAADIRYNLEGNILRLNVERGERHYTKDVVLPAAVRAPQNAPSYRNGIFEIKLPKVAEMAGSH